MDLIVWYDRADVPTGFQLCYRALGRSEHALTWRVGKGFSHARVDTGSRAPGSGLSPILVPDGDVPWAWLRDEFLESASSLDPAVRELVLRNLAIRA